jgi:hypothetical protein
VLDGQVPDDLAGYMKSFEMVWEQSYPYQPEK